MDEYENLRKKDNRVYMSDPGFRAMVEAAAKQLEEEEKRKSGYYNPVTGKRVPEVKDPLTIATGFQKLHESTPKIYIADKSNPQKKPYGITQDDIEKMRLINYDAAEKMEELIAMSPAYRMYGEEGAGKELSLYGKELTKIIPVTSLGGAVGVKGLDLIIDAGPDAYNLGQAIRERLKQEE